MSDAGAAGSGALELTLRLATPAAGPGCAAVYGPVVERTIISFEFEAPSGDEMARRIETTLRSHPWLVVEAGADSGAIAGYAYASPHHARPGYRWSADVSVYLAATYRGRGIGRALYTALLELLRLQGVHNAYAGITPPNPASVGLHEAMGFRRFATFERVGWKDGAWHDVDWFDLRVRPTDGPPTPFRRLDELSADEVAAALATGAARLTEATRT